MKTLAYSSAITFLFLVFVSHFAGANVPPVPADPYSDDAFSKVREFYRIQKSIPAYKVTGLQTKSSQKFTLQTVRLKVDGYPEVEMTLKLPNAFRPPLSALVLFTGFQTGSESINLIGDPDNSVYVGFQYPWPVTTANGSVQWNWQRMQMIPVLMSVGMAWLHQQPYINKNKINVITVSFGTLFYPLAQRLLNLEGLSSKTTVFAYGGVDIPEVVAGEMKKKIGQNEVEVAKALIRQQTWFLEPKYHVSHLRGPFLVVNGEEDTVFPLLSQQQLFDNLAEPKKIVSLPGGHIQPDKKELIQLFMREVQQFLRDNQAL